MKVIVAILFTITTLCARAQSEYNFFHLFLDKGLSDARVNSITQDKYGFMWFATPNGLNRYDGYSFKTFYVDKSTGLTSNNILTIFNSSKGDLWVGTTSGAVKYNFVEEKFQRFSGSEIDSASISCFVENEDGSMYAGTAQGLFYLDDKTNKWENLSRSFKLANRLTNIRGLLFFKKDLLFATTENRGFYKIDAKNKKLLDTIPYKTEFGDTCCLFMLGMRKLNDNEMLIGTLSYGLNKFNVTTNTFSTTIGVLGKSDSVRFNTVSQIVEDHTGRFWAASAYFRLAEYLPAENSVIHFQKDPYNPYGFDGTTATCVYEDRQHNLWVGTSARGIYRFNPNQKRVQFFSQDDFLPGKLKRGQVTAIASLDSNTVMIGEDSGPSFYSRSTNSFINYKGGSYDHGNNPLEQVQCGVKDKNGIVWMGSNRLGIMRYDPATKTFKVYSRFALPYPLKGDGVFDVLDMGGDSLMLNGFNRIATFNTKTTFNNSFRNIIGSKLYDITRVTDLCHDKKKHIWACTAAGNLYEYDPVSHEVFNRSSLLSAYEKAPPIIYKIEFDNDNRLYCATSIGAICIEQGKPVKLYSIATAENTSHEVKGVLPVGTDVWMCNSRRVAKLNTLTGRIIFLGEKDGLIDVQLFGNTITRSPWGSVLIGSNRGVYEIFTDRIGDNNYSSPAYLTNFRVYDKPFTTKEVISTVKNINLSYDQNFFSFDLSAFDYSEANDIEYAYKLEGFDKDWQYIGKQRSGSYTNVPGGDYTLKLKAKNTSGEWNEQGQSIKIHIAQPFWKTWWFISLMIIAAAGLIYFIYRNRIKSIRKEARLRSNYEIKLNELENSALRTQMNPHFIFNSLNTINSFINRNDPAKANQYISKFSKLIRLILDHSREKKIALSDELEVLELYVQIERIRFDNKFDYKISLDDQINPETTEIPPLIIQPFVENAILHGLLPLQQGGVLHVSLQKSDNHLLCLVVDNGIGREKAKQTKPHGGGAKRKSHGIDITLKRIELFNKEHGFNGVVNFIDLKDINGNALGTKVEIPVAWEESY